MTQEEKMNAKPRIFKIYGLEDYNSERQHRYFWVNELTMDINGHYLLDQMAMDKEISDQFWEKYENHWGEYFAIKHCEWATFEMSKKEKHYLEDEKQDHKLIRDFVTIGFITDINQISIVKNPKNLLTGLNAMEASGKEFISPLSLRKKSYHWDMEEAEINAFLNGEEKVEYEDGDIGPNSTEEEIEAFFADDDYDKEVREPKSIKQDTPVVEVVEEIVNRETKESRTERVENKVAVIKNEAIGLTEDSFADKIALTIKNIKEMCMPEGSSETEAKQFFAFCQSYKLNPFISELSWRSTGNNKGTVQIHYNAILKIANRNPNYDGFEHGVIVETEDGQELQIEGNRAPKGTKLLGGWAKVYRKDRRVPVTKMVSFEDYRPKYANWTKTLWFKLPGTMITKVASAQAHREAFPEDLSGMYSGEELDQAGGRK